MIPTIWCLVLDRDTECLHCCRIIGTRMWLLTDYCGTPCTIWCWTVDRDTECRIIGTRMWLAMLLLAQWLGWLWRGAAEIENWITRVQRRAAALGTSYLAGPRKWGISNIVKHTKMNYKKLAVFDMNDETVWGVRSIFAAHEMGHNFSLRPFSKLFRCLRVTK